MNLKGMVVVVTGASSGIGREIASQMATRGARLMLVARRASLLQEVVEEAKRLGGVAEFETVDLSTREGPGRVVQAALERFGTVDALVNNAGATAFGPFDEVDDETVHRVIATNLEAPMYACKAVIPHFKERRKGTVVNVSSLAAFSTPPWLTTYAVTKSGLLALSKNLRFELRPFGINVIGVYPGDVDTTFAQSARLTKTTEPMRHLLTGSRRLFVTKSQVAKVVVDAVEKGGNADLFVGGRARLARFFIVHAPGLVDAAMRREYAGLLGRAQMHP